MDGYGNDEFNVINHGLDISFYYNNVFSRYFLICIPDGYNII